MVVVDVVVDPGIVVVVVGLPPPVPPPPLPPGAAATAGASRPSAIATAAPHVMRARTRCEMPD